MIAKNTEHTSGLERILSSRFQTSVPTVSWASCSIPVFRAVAPLAESGSGASWGFAVLSIPVEFFLFFMLFILYWGTAD